MIKKILILTIIGALVVTSALNGYLHAVSGRSIQEMTDTLGNVNIAKTSSNLYEKGFIYGRICKLTYVQGLVAFEVVKIHVITFCPFNFNTYLGDTRVSLLNACKGFFGNHMIFVWGEFSTIPAESDIIHLTVAERDSTNCTIQWMVTDTPIIQRNGVSWALLDANNTNVSGTTVTIQNGDERCITTVDMYTVKVERHGIYTFYLTYGSTHLLLFKSEPEMY